MGPRSARDGHERSTGPESESEPNPKQAPNPAREETA